MSEKISEDEFNQRGVQLVEVESQFLDGIYDEELFVRRIEQYKIAIAMNIYWMGRDLVVLKENCGHGNFLPLLDKMGISPRSAQQSMRVAAKFNTPKLQQLLQGLNNDKGASSKLLALALESDDDLESLVNGGTIAELQLDDIDRMSATEVRKALRKAKEDTKAELEAKDELISQKNKHADDLATKLAKAQGLPQAMRWSEPVEVYRKELTAYGLDAEELINTVNNLILSLSDIDAPESAKQSMALHTKDLVNVIISACGQLSNTVYDQLGFYINQPTYSISDELTMIDEDQEAS